MGMKRFGNNCTHEEENEKKNKWQNKIYVCFNEWMYDVYVCVCHCLKYVFYAVQFTFQTFSFDGNP